MSHDPQFCPEFHKAVELIGQRWTGAIIREMLAGECRFSELRHAIPEISDRMLCARLKGLETAGIVERRVYAETPVRVEYQLTDKGLALQHVFSAIGDWAYQWNLCPDVSAKDTDAA